MTRIAVFSDSHGSEETLRELIDRALACGHVNAFVHCGDGAREFAALESVMLLSSPSALCLGVRGNCDFAVSGVPDVQTALLGGVRVLIAHGHLYGVKQQYSSLAYAAREKGCTLALFGHTHYPETVEMGGVTLVNPGSAADGRFALVEISPEGGITPKLLRL